MAGLALLDELANISRWIEAKRVPGRGTGAAATLRGGPQSVRLRVSAWLCLSGGTSGGYRGLAVCTLRPPAPTIASRCPVTAIVGNASCLVEAGSS